MKNVVVTEIAKKTWHINEAGMDSLYLLEGDDSCLLIDTGTGSFDLPELLGWLTDKPVRAVLTHGHLDHAGGMGFFREIFLHPAEKAGAMAVTRKERQEYVRMMMVLAKGLYHVQTKDVREFSEWPLFQEIREGSIFHLGERDVEVLETPGHTAGGLSFLDRKEKLLFSGDACYHTILLGFGEGNGPGKRTGISAVLETAEKLQALTPYYSRHYYGHVAEGPERSVLPLPHCLPEDLARLCRDLLSGRAAGERKSAGEFCGEHLEAVCPTVRIQYQEVYLQ